MASGTSKKMELKLTNVARASLEELLLDYQGFLRQRNLEIWSKDSPLAVRVRAKLKSLQDEPSDESDMSDPLRLKHTTAKVAANIMLCLVNQASYLLGRQIKRLEKDFADGGGFTERLYTYRKQRQRDY
jgi:four helix bundle suffix protein